MDGLTTYQDAARREELKPKKFDKKAYWNQKRGPKGVNQKKGKK